MTGPVQILKVRDGTLLLEDWEAGLGRTLRAEGPYPLACADVPGHPLLDAQGLPLPNLEPAESAVLASVPDAIRRLAAPCGRFQWVALEAMRHVPDFTGFLRQEAEAAGYGFVVAGWALSGVRTRGRGDRLRLAARLTTEPRAELIADLAGLAAPDAAIVRLLERTPAEDVDYPLTIGLSRLCGVTAARRALLETPRLSGAAVRALLLLPEWLMTPAIARAAAAGATPERLRWTTARLDELTAAERRRVLAAVKGAEDWPGVERRLNEVTCRILRERPFPPPPIPGDAMLQPIRSGDDLADEGHALRHCVANYEDEVRTGRRYYYRWLGTERATVEISLAEDFRWRLTEALGPGNAELSDATWADLRRIVERQTEAQPLLLETYVAGSMYYGAAEVWKRLAWGTPLRLKREPANPHDPLAIEVFTETGVKLGYLPRAVNRETAELMDRGGAPRADVAAAESLYDIRIRVHAA